jgi:predicted DNA-binding transcriptional regulator YafY
MNRTDRLLAIVLELQGKGRQRAEDLAATFETSKRTIYRDVLALGEAGVPIVSVPGRGYSLMKGYFLPPLSFTTDEATMLLLGSDLMAQNFDAQYRAAAQSASRKIEGVLPDTLRDEVHYLQNSIVFVAGTPDTAESARRVTLLQQLRRAIIQRSTVRFCYHARHAREGRGEQTTREADPYGLIHFPSGWHMVAHCHLRQDTRNFRLDRIDRLEILLQTFQRPAGYVMRQDPEREREARSIKVRALFDSEIARWVQEARSYYVTHEEERPEGLLVTLQVRQESEIIHWLLSWGQHVRILEPESLRLRLVEEAEGMLRNYGVLSNLREC